MKDNKIRIPYVCSNKECGKQNGVSIALQNHNSVIRKETVSLKFSHTCKYCGVRNLVIARR